MRSPTVPLDDRVDAARHEADPHDAAAKPQAAQTKEDEREGHQRSSTRVQVIHAAITEDGEHELQRSNQALAFSGLAAGMSMSFSMLTQALFDAALPHAAWTKLISSLGYTSGFIIVILGRQQLFTENTLTVILPLMKDFSRRRFLSVLRVWAIVLISNVAGGVLVAWVLEHTSAVSPATRQALGDIGARVVDAPFATLVLRGIFAGWLIATLVWLLPAAESGRVSVILIVSYLVALGEFSHVIVGSIEVSFAAFAGRTSFATAFGSFFPAVLLGNILGGVSLTAGVNHAQVATDEPPLHGGAR